MWRKSIPKYTIQGPVNDPGSLLEASPAGARGGVFSKNFHTFLEIDTVFSDTEILINKRLVTLVCVVESV
jgi:hypothetical protein